MSLSDKAREAREHADQCTNAGCHGLANALEGALDAEFVAIRDAHREPDDLTGIPAPSPTSVRIQNPAATDIALVNPTTNIAVPPPESHT